MATGLAWTPYGGEVLFIEATAMPGQGKLTITGQLGDVMRESAQAAVSYVRSNVSDVLPDVPDRLVRRPTTSTSTCRPARRRRTARAPAWRWSPRSPRCSPGGSSAADVAMTGEITLTGQVLPIGGLKEKALAAQRNKLHCVIAPELNEQDIDEIPEHLRQDLDFRFVSTVDEVLDLALQRRPVRKLVA